MEALSPFLMPILFIAFFYFLLIRPQQKRNKQIQQMRANLQVGDNIMTVGGIYGKIIKIKDNVITIESGADKVRLQISRDAVGVVLKEEVE